MIGRACTFTTSQGAAMTIQQEYDETRYLSLAHLIDTIENFTGNHINVSFLESDPVVGSKGGVEHSFYTGNKIHRLLDTTSGSVHFSIYLMVGGTWLSSVKIGSKRPIVRHHATTELDAVLDEWNISTDICTKFVQEAIEFVR